jgi:hypothetical protein
MVCICICICIVVLAFPVPSTHSFGCSPTAATRSGRHGYGHGHGQSRNTIGIYSFPPKTLLSTTAIHSLSPNKNSDKNSNNEDDDEGGEKRLLDDKNIPGLVFTTVLTLWHFWIGPAIRPFLLDMKQWHT